MGLTTFGGEGVELEGDDALQEILVTRKITHYSDDFADLTMSDRPSYSDDPNFTLDSFPQVFRPDIEEVSGTVNVTTDGLELEDDSEAKIAEYYEWEDQYGNDEEDEVYPAFGLYQAQPWTLEFEATVTSGGTLTLIVMPGPFDDDLEVWVDQSEVQVRDWDDADTICSVDLDDEFDGGGAGPWHVTMKRWIYRPDQEEYELTVTDEDGNTANADGIIDDRFEPREISDGENHHGPRSWFGVSTSGITGTLHWVEMY